jgi:Sulfite exporter TauE/SafE.
VTFILVAPERIDWAVAALIAVGSLAGGYVGARVGRRLSPRVLRSVIVVIGVAAIAKMVT